MRSATVVVMAPTVEFSGEQLVSGTVRACAGGVDDHAAVDPNPETHNDSQYRAHTRRVDLTVKLNGELMPNAKFTLRFEGNRGHDYGDGRAKKTAKLHKMSDAFDVSHPWQETLKVQANGAGKLSVWVLSSDVISQPKLQAILKLVPAPKEPVKLGEIECDFAPSISFRHFIPKNAKGEPLVDADEEDTGWIFDFPHLVNPDNDDHMTPAKVYLKFKIDPGKDDDAQGNWQFVNGHEVRISIHSVEVLDEENGETKTVAGTPTELKRYAYVAPTSGGQSSVGEVTATRTTTSQGETAPQVYVLGGDDLDKVTTIYVQVEDLTEHKE